MAEGGPITTINDSQVGIFIIYSLSAVVINGRDLYPIGGSKFRNHDIYIKTDHCRR